MNTPFKKRSNPLAQTVAAAEPQKQTIQQEPVVQKQTIQQEVPVQTQFVQQEPVIQSKPAPKTVQQPQNYYYQQPQTPVVSNNNREKYTATMEKELRIRVKVASARKGIQFSQFVEEAVLEKLRREGL